MMLTRRRTALKRTQLVVVIERREAVDLVIAVALVDRSRRN
jgi:hypothetical protein